MATRGGGRSRLLGAWGVCLIHSKRSASHQVRLPTLCVALLVPLWSIQHLLPSGYGLPHSLAAFADCCDRLLTVQACGLPRAEAASLDLANCITETGELRVRAGRGQKDRRAYIPNGSASALDNWAAR